MTPGGIWSCLSVPNTETGQVAKECPWSSARQRMCSEALGNSPSVGHQRPHGDGGQDPRKGWSVGWVSGSLHVTEPGAAQALPDLPD